MPLTTEATDARQPTAAREEPAGQGHRWVLPVALVLVVVPFVVAAVRMLATRSAFWNSGDQALVGLSVHEAGRLHQFVGPYSRYGWSHPGPSWFYVLSPFYKLFGSTDAALVAANIVVQGLFAASIVAAAHRRRQPAFTLAVAAIVALYALRMPASFFVYVWNPLALMLATALFFVLATRARDGRWTDLLLLVITGSYLVQTHVGTGPLVGAVGLCALVAFVLGRRAGTPPMGRRDLIMTVGLGVVLVAMWVPPLYQQLTAPAHQGNLSKVVHFALHQGSASHSMHQALIAAGRVLVMMPYGWGTGPYQIDVGTLSAAVALGLLGQALLSIGLIAAGRRWKSRGAMWTGIITFVALLAAVASARNASGTLYWYLLTWISVLPAVTLIGVAALALDTRRARDGASTLLRVALTVVLVLVAAGLGRALSRGLDFLPNSPGVGAGTAVTDAALRGQKPATIKVNIETPDLWVIGAGLANELAVEGWTVKVGPQSGTLFGAYRVNRGPERTEVTVIASDDPRVPALVAGGLRDLGSMETELGRTTILLKARG